MAKTRKSKQDRRQHHPKDDASHRYQQPYREQRPRRAPRKYSQDHRPRQSNRDGSRIFPDHPLPQHDILHIHSRKPHFNLLHRTTHAKPNISCSLRDFHHQRYHTTIQSIFQEGIHIQATLHKFMENLRAIMKFNPDDMDWDPTFQTIIMRDEQVRETTAMIRRTSVVIGNGDVTGGNTAQFRVQAETPINRNVPWEPSVTSASLNHPFDLSFNKNERMDTSEGSGHIGYRSVAGHDTAENVSGIMGCSRALPPTGIRADD